MSGDVSGLISNLRTANNAATIEELRAENERLRAIVEAVRNVRAKFGTGDGERDALGYFVRWLNEALDAALSPSTPLVEPSRDLSAHRNAIARATWLGAEE